MRTIGISPKVVADLLVSVAAFLVAYLPLGIDPVLAATVGKLLGTVAAYLAAPGTVATPPQENATASLERP